MPHVLEYNLGSECDELPFGGVSMSALVKMPKVDLHRHLIGAIRAEVLVYIANKLGISLGAFGNDAERIRKSSVISKSMVDGYEHFLRKRIWSEFKGILSKPEGIHNAVYWAVADAARDGVVYVEFRVSPNAIEFNPSLQMTLHDFISALRKGIEVARRDFPETLVKMILSVGRSGVIERWGDASERRRRFEKLIAVAKTSRDIIVGFDLTGNEIQYPNPLFVEFSELVKASDFLLTVHSGETGSPSAVWEAINLLKVDRIGHGIGAMDDASLMKTLADRRIPLEICPTSNLMLGIVPSLKEHPCREFLARDLCVTVNTDDPVLLGPTTLSREFYQLLAAEQIRFSDIEKITTTSIKASFASSGEKNEIQSRVNAFFLEAPPLAAVG